MKVLLPYNPKTHGILYKVAILTFVCIVVLHGTYLRARSGLVVPTMDWLILARLLTCAIGFLTGTILIAKNMPLGFGAKMLLLYAGAAGLSAVTSPYPTTVVGYFILLLGACLLMIGLTYSARSLAELELIEKVWFFTVAVLIMKDTITSLIFPEMAPPGEVVRLGMGVTHANELSLLAALVFWISFRQTTPRNQLIKPTILWLLRAFLIYVIFGTRTRISLAAFLIGGLFYLLFKRRNYFMRWPMISSAVVVVTTFFLLSLCLNQGWAKDIVEYARRGQKGAALTTLSARTLIWEHAFNKSLESPIIGHGYGVSRLTMGDVPNAPFKPYHCHNAVLEVFFNTGLLGLIPFLIVLIYSLGWIKSSSRLRLIFSTDLALHALCSIVILFISSIFEVTLAGRVGPAQLLLFLYLLALDREKAFL